MQFLTLSAVLCGVLMWATALSPPAYKTSPSSFCPSEEREVGVFCYDDCEKDADCGTYERCCHLKCGKSRCLERFQETYSPFCPVDEPVIYCIAYHHSCSNDEQCRRTNPGTNYCCPSSCGNACRVGNNTLYG